MSFIVLTHNSIRVIDRCVRSLVQQATTGVRDEIWLVDNGSSDGTAAAARALQDEFSGIVTSVFLERNHGTTVSRNIALRRARGNYVVIVDSDVYAPPGCVDTLIAHLDARAEAGLITPALAYPDGRLQLSADHFPTPWHKAKRWLMLKSMERGLNAAPGQDGIREVDYAISAFWVMKRQVVSTVGLLDELIFYAPEDVDYCIRLWQAGYSVLYDPTVQAVHDAQEISRRTLRSVAWSHLGGLLYLFRKHRYLTRASLHRRFQRRRARAAAA